MIGKSLLNPNIMMLCIMHLGVLFRSWDIDVQIFVWLLSKPPEIGAEGPDFGWSATSEASHGTPEGGLFKKTAK